MNNTSFLVLLLCKLKIIILLYLYKLTNRVVKVSCKLVQFERIKKFIDFTMAENVKDFLAKELSMKN